MHTPGPTERVGKKIYGNLDKSPRRAPIARCDLSHGLGEAAITDDDNARLLAAAYTSYDRAFGDRAVEAAEADLLGQIIDALTGDEVPDLWRLGWLKTLLILIDTGDATLSDEDPDANWEMLSNIRDMVEKLDAILARVPEGGGA